MSEETEVEIRLPGWLRFLVVLLAAFSAAVQILILFELTEVPLWMGILALSVMWIGLGISLVAKPLANFVEASESTAARFLKPWMVLRERD